MQKKYIQPILGPMLQKIAPRMGWKIVGQINFKNGRRRYFRYSSLDLNPLGASEIAKDKDYANFFMKRIGYPTVRGETFFSEEWAKAIGSKRMIAAAFRFAKKIGFPVIVKPNSGSQGSNVSLVYSRKEFYRALRTVFKHDRVGLVQQRISGKDFRIVVSVTGDGRSTIFSLLQKRQRSFIVSSRDTQLKLDDRRIRPKLRKQGLSMRSVPKRGQRIFLLDNANLSTGGDAAEVKRMHPEFKKLAIKLTKDMGLRLCGVDLMVEGNLAEKPGKFWILEINAAPGLDHYARSGKAQKKIVEDMYLKVLKSLEK